MLADKWVENFGEPVSISDLCNPQAIGLVHFLDRYADAVASFVEARRQDDKEMVVANVRTGRPQDPVYPIHHVEKVGIVFEERDIGPTVVVLRDDFPDTGHQFSITKGHPACICIDDRPWEEARITWTAADLINRISLWFYRAGIGELHDAGQPLDPNLLRDCFSFTVADSILTEHDSADLVAEFNQPQSPVLHIKHLSECCLDVDSGFDQRWLPICVVTYQVPPKHMKRMEHVPSNLGELKAMLQNRGDMDLYEDLSRRFVKWLSEKESVGKCWRFNSKLAIIVKMPIISLGDEQLQGEDLRAFITEKPVGDIAVGLDVALSTGKDTGSNIGYVNAIGSPCIKHEAVDPVALVSAEVHLKFGRGLATRLAGRTHPDNRKVVLLGAGAMGSHLANCLVREGRFQWTIIDHDFVLPHNLARHIAQSNQVGWSKAEVLSQYLNSTLSDDSHAEPVNRKLYTDGDQEEVVAEALKEADLIIDATASVAAAHALSSHSAAARRFSVFFNPSGEAAVLLAEPSGRALNLCDLEAQYLGLVLRTKRLANHLGKPAETIAYIGACRAVTNRIPQSRVSVLSGLAAVGLSDAVDKTNAVISVWSLAPNGRVTFDSVSPQPVSRYHAHGWIITIDVRFTKYLYSMRNARLPNETGGILFGLVDIPRKSIHLVDASPAPADSDERRSSFTRGKEGVQELIETAGQRTMEQIRYVGEWHSHPPYAVARPSSVDLDQIDWLSAVMRMDCMPALMLIVGDKEITPWLGKEKAKLIS